MGSLCTYVGGKIFTFLATILVSGKLVVCVRERGEGGEVTVAEEDTIGNIHELFFLSITTCVPTQKKRCI